ncbi:hypothetical protein BASA81_001687 [Batrachochytrium salamandrivorans]|nr:hypothetical protein BASA81_001687 [Batrachochytrium salamandrivorans]
MNTGGGGGGGRGRGRGGGGGRGGYQGNFYAQPQQQQLQPGGFNQYPPNNNNPTFNNNSIPASHGQSNSAFTKKPPRMAQHVKFVPGMHFNICKVAQLVPSTVVTGFCLNLIPNPALPPGSAPRVQLFTSAMDGSMIEFNCDTGLWQKSRGTIMPGPTTCVLAVDSWVFVAYLIGGDRGAIKAFNLSSGREFVLMDGVGTQTLDAAHLGKVTCMTVGNNMLVTGGSDGQAKAWNFLGEDQGGWQLFGTFASPLGNGEEISCMKPLPKLGLLFTCTTIGSIKMWRLNEGTLIGIFPNAHQGSICGLDMLNVGLDQVFLLTAGLGDMFIRLWQVNTNGLIPVHQVSTIPPSNPNYTSKPPVPLSAIKIIQTLGHQPEHQLFVGSQNGSINVYRLKSTTQFDRIGVVDGHQRFSKVVGFDVVPTGPGSQMMCAITENGNVNWFGLE